MGQQVRHLLQKRESTSNNQAFVRQRVEWPRADLIGYIIQVENLRRILNLWGPIYSISRASKKTPSHSDSISLLTLYMWASDIYEGSPTPVTAFLSIAPKISISANISRLSIYGSYGSTLQQIFFFCSIVSMILGALAAMAQTKVKILLAHSSIGHVGYICTGFSFGTIEGIQSLLIGIFIYASMKIDAFAIVSALRQSRVKYIADLGALAKTNPISAITFSITMFAYAGIPPLTGFFSKFYLFFAALGCGAYFLAPIAVVTNVIVHWAAERLPRGVSMRPKKGNDSGCLHCIVAGYLSLRSNNRKSKAALSYGQCPLYCKEASLLTTSLATRPVGQEELPFLVLDPNSISFRSAHAPCEERKSLTVKERKHSLHYPANLMMDTQAVLLMASRTSLYGPIELGVVATLEEEGEDSANSFSVCLGSKVFRAWKEGKNLGLGGEGMVVWHL
ncbi:putative NADH:ubiquinone reductase [Tanacetum coccineum]